MDVHSEPRSAGVYLGHVSDAPVATLGEPAVYGATARPLTVLIDSRNFVRDCLSSSLQAADAESDCLTFDNVQDWQASGLSAQTSLLLFWANQLSSTSELEQQLAELKALALEIPFAVMSDQENPEAIVELMAGGARAFLPTSLSLDVIVKALHLVRAGGTFIPATCLAAMSNDGARSVPAPADLAGLFSPRQLAVARAMRKGMPNKIIAYELAMCESTVKVHVRNIMKKLKAKNRTEVAFLTQRLFPQD
ncbi:LuxR C-terminal-related transcriptional regulator [Chelatococcus reniformis]|uniref:DNA-binding response regulator n=1 Tax=Chelatococcus reniformis TaxID=1494448 RepID=A0A916UCG8_9HYPH|nr:response regulator transcription factor [Chelatococcus reniformis]GGC67798.1 DNA-binding response regulator [Chelatococcus reniformis]